MSLLTSTSQWEGALCGRVSYHEVRGGATSPRSLEQPGPIAAGQLQNSAYNNHARSRRQVNSSRAIAGRLLLCAYRQTANFRQSAEAIEMGQLPPVSNELHAMAFAAGQKQNASQRSDRQTFTC